MAQYKREQRTRDLISRRHNLNSSTSVLPSASTTKSGAAAVSADSAEDEDQQCSGQWNERSRSRPKSVQQALSSPTPSTSAKRARTTAPTESYKPGNCDNLTAFASNNSFFIITFRYLCIKYTQKYYLERMLLIMHTPNMRPANSER